MVFILNLCAPLSAIVYTVYSWLWANQCLCELALLLYIIKKEWDLLLYTLWLVESIVTLLCVCFFVCFNCFTNVTWDSLNTTAGICVWFIFYSSAFVSKYKKLRSVFLLILFYIFLLFAAFLCWEGIWPVCVECWCCQPILLCGKHS